MVDAPVGDGWLVDGWGRTSPADFGRKAEAAGMTVCCVGVHGLAASATMRGPARPI
jgi:hypothetical protein